MDCYYVSMWHAFHKGNIYGLAMQESSYAAPKCFNPFEPEFTIVISSTTSRELLPQFSTSSEWRWLDVV